jgi:hypothetical protein
MSCLRLLGLLGGSDLKTTGASRVALLLDVRPESNLRSPACLLYNAAVKMLKPGKASGKEENSKIIHSGPSVPVPGNA